mmetsp:Transcript_4814/g.7109  ORF Transcript_4814/g.7109 Transcript_4814/m.7109 type:complete len:305 (+) Transcript_4814:118-1032(+)
MVLEAAFAFLTGNFPFSVELQSICMALQGAMIIRSGVNKDGTMAWFHAFARGVIISYGGALFTPLWMARPTPMLTNDLNMASCILAYVLVNCTPSDLGYSMASLFPIRLLTVMGSQLFRTMGILKFVQIAYTALKDSPSDYYPTPIFGPILNAAVLGNMGSFFALGFDGHLKNGMPLPFQNGLFIASLYHFTINDKDGPIGVLLRSALEPVFASFGLSHQEAITVFASLFMQTWAILKMPDFIGPSFDPFGFLSIATHILSREVKRPVKVNLEISASANNSQATNNSEKKKKRKKKNNSKKKKD